LNPTLSTIKKVGGVAEKGKKTLSLADIYPMFKTCKSSTEKGGFHDFVEILKLFDITDKKTMLGYELFKLLTNLSKTLTKEEAKTIIMELSKSEENSKHLALINIIPRRSGMP
jgi:Ca2+-binding EF-hand superfamily protein